MAHFAELNANNEVIRVIIVSNAVITDEFGSEHERLGQEFCYNLFGGNWIKTSYNNKFRKHFAQPGAIYFAEHDAFSKGPKPFPSWKLNTVTMEWDPPKPKPPFPCEWNEEKQKWIALVEVTGKFKELFT